MENTMENPIVIMLINMTIVFAVLWLLSLFIRLVHLIDPTKPRVRRKKVPVSATKKAADKPQAVAAAPAAPVVAPGISGETVAAIAGALAAYGVGFSQIRAIHPAEMSHWAEAAHIHGMNGN